MAKKTPPPAAEVVPLETDHKGNGFQEPRSSPFSITDQGKVEAMRHLLLPPDLRARIEMSDFTSLEVVPNAIIMTQIEFCRNPNIDLTEEFMMWFSAFRRAVDGGLSEKTILVNRSDASKINNMGQFGDTNIGGTGLGF